MKMLEDENTDCEKYFHFAYFEIWAENDWNWQIFCKWYLVFAEKTYIACKIITYKISSILVIFRPYFKIRLFRHLLRCASFVLAHLYTWLHQVELHSQSFPDKNIRVVGSVERHFQLLQLPVGEVGPGAPSFHITRVSSPTEFVCRLQIVKVHVLSTAHQLVVVSQSQSSVTSRRLTSLHVLFKISTALVRTHFLFNFVTFCAFHFLKTCKRSVWHPNNRKKRWGKKCRRHETCKNMTLTLRKV